MSKKYKPAAAVIVLILLVAVIGIVTHVVMKRIPTRQTMDLSEYYGELADGEAALILGDEKLETRALIVGEKVYLPLDVVNTYLFYLFQIGLYSTYRIFIAHSLPSLSAHDARSLNIISSI